MKNILLLLLPLLVSNALFAAEPEGAPAAKADDWLRPPAKFLAARFVRAADAPAKNYDVILDVPPVASPKDAKPKVAQSCGDGVIDGIAWDYAKSLVTELKPLSEMNKQKELRLQIRMSALPVKRTNFTPPALPAGVKYYAPRPPYPSGESIRGEGGEARLRVTFARGRVSQVAVEESTGIAALDANAALYILAYWASGHGAENATCSIPMTYRIVRGAHTGSYTGGF